MTTGKRSVIGPSRRFAAAQQFSSFRSEADIQRVALTEPDFRCRAAGSPVFSRYTDDALARRFSLPCTCSIGTAAANSVGVRRNRVPGYDRRFTADWAQDNERRVAGQEAERQRMADYNARLTKQQEERENAEARERAAALKRKNTV